MIMKFVFTSLVLLALSVEMVTAQQTNPPTAQQLAALAVYQRNAATAQLTALNAKLAQLQATQGTNAPGVAAITNRINTITAQLK